MTARVQAQATPAPAFGPGGFAKRLSSGNFRVDSLNGAFAVGASITGTYEPKQGVLIVKVSEGRFVARHATMKQEVVGVKAMLVEWPPAKKWFNPVAKSEQFSIGKTLSKGDSFPIRSVTFEIPVDPNISYENRWLAFEIASPTGTCYAHVETFIGTTAKNGIHQ